MTKWERELKELDSYENHMERAKVEALRRIAEELNALNFILKEGVNVNAHVTPPSSP